MLSKIKATEKTNVNIAASYILGKAITVSGEPIQGVFNYSIELGSEEASIPVENLTIISMNNDDI